ncbi:hypothetical protein NL108_017780 [Boleophthalmus pectinirostris]|nr:hypothetical protein NL108_017780 [Boleophthalmus pectinirostris]
MSPCNFAQTLMCLSLGIWGPFPALSHVTLSGQVGQSVTLNCNCQDSNIVMCYWYKQVFGEIPVRITSYNKYEGEVTNIKVDTKFKNRFRLNNTDNYNNLEIKGLIVSDAATYFCMSSNLYKLDFLEVVTVDVDGAGFHFATLDYELTVENSSVQRVSELSCIFNNGICEEKHQVYWFNTLYESAKGILYSHGGSSDQCEGRMDSSTKSCVYDLPVRSDSADSNLEKCAVASCGKLLFGTKSKWDSEDKSTPSVLVQVLSGALVGTLILCVLLSLVIYNIKKKSQPTVTTENEEDIHYAALKHQSSSRPKSHADSTNTECVYSGVRL